MCCLRAPRRSLAGFAWRRRDESFVEGDAVTYLPYIAELERSDRSSRPHGAAP